MAGFVRRTGLGVVLLMLGATSCGGGDGETSSGSGTQASSSTVAPGAQTTVVTVPFTLPPTTTVPPPEGVESYAVTPTHTSEPVVYPQTPPVGGPHNPVWETCVFRDRPVPSESAVHSLEHGAIWITYRPDLPADQLAVLSRLASSRRDVLVSRWDVGLPSPLVASSWGRQLKLESANDPRLLQFILAFTGRAPEPGAPC